MDFNLVGVLLGVAQPASFPSRFTGSLHDGVCEQTQALILASRGTSFPEFEPSNSMTTPKITSVENLPILYVKTGCPWCNEAIRFLTDNGVSYREKNVTEDAAAFEEMKTKSKQTKAPVLDWQGHILADFGEDELVPFLRKRNVKFEDS